MTARTRLSNTFSISRLRVKIVAVTSLLVALAGCGGGGGSSDDLNPSNPCNLLLTVVTAGLSCALGVVTGTVPATPSSPPTTAPPPSSTPAASRYQNVPDLEPNNDSSTATVAYFPMRADPTQRVGFRVDGSVNDSTDGVDSFSFTSTEARTLHVELCMAGSFCDSNRLQDVGVAFVEVLDQFGTILWTTEADLQSGNSRIIDVDAGVLYYVLVVAENTFGNNVGYILDVMETSDPADPIALQALTPSAPLSSVSGAPSLTVTLDWTPPNTNTDGSALLDLSGYTISYADVGGPCCGTYPTTEIDIDNPGLVTYVLDLPSPGDWAISMTARNASGQVSAASNTVTVTVDDPWLIPVPGQTVSYQFSTDAMSGGTDLALASLFSGATVTVTFDYDNSASATPMSEYTEYVGGLLSLSGAVNGSSFSGFGGSVIVSDDRYGPPAVQDMLQLSTDALNFAGFDTGTHRLVGVRIFWLEGQNSISDFLADEDLPTALPGFEGRLGLDFTPIATPGPVSSVFFDGVFVVPGG